MGKPYLSKLAILIAIQLLFTQSIHARNRTVTGTVSDQTGKGIPGVNVTERGTNNATQTNSNGVYRLTVADNATLLFSFVGYGSIEVSGAGKTSVDALRYPGVKCLLPFVITYQLVFEWLLSFKSL